MLTNIVFIIFIYHVYFFPRNSLILAAAIKLSPWWPHNYVLGCSFARCLYSKAHSLVLVRSGRVWRLMRANVPQRVYCIFDRSFFSFNQINGKSEHLILEKSCIPYGKENYVEILVSWCFFCTKHMGILTYCMHFKLSKRTCKVFHQSAIMLLIKVNLWVWRNNSTIQSHCLILTVYLKIIIWLSQQICSWLGNF